MKICPCCSFQTKYFALANKPLKNERAEGVFNAKKQTNEELNKSYYSHLKNAILFKGKRNNKPKSYLSSKYLFIHKSDSILNKGNKIRPDKDEYSKEEVEVILAEKIADEKALKILANHIMELISENNTDSGYIKKILELVYANKLSPNVLLGLTKGLCVNENLKADIDTLFDCYRNDKDVAEAFVPTFRSKEDALYSLDVGDVCQIEGDDRISIKQNENQIEKLYISKTTCLELFPPVERFLFTQSKQQDCYFISVFDAIYSNPISRYKILGLFNERKNGKVDATFGGYKYIGSNVTNRDFGRHTLKDVSKTLNARRRVYSNFMAQTSEALRALEVLNSEEQRKNAESKINRKYHLYKKLLTQSSEKTIFNDGFQYSREELEDFVNLYESSKSLKNIISTSDMNIPVFDVDYGSVLYGLKLLDENKCAKADTKWERYILERYKEYLERTGKKTVPFEEIIPIETYQDIFQWEIDTDTPSPYTYGGNAFSTFRVFDLPSMLLPLNDNEIAESLLNLPDIDKKLVLTCSTPYENESKYNIKPFHSYSLIPKEKDGKRIFVVKNPVNTIQAIELTKEELKKYFNVIAFGLIEPSSFNLP